MNHPEKKDILIVGGGITGLCLAYMVAKEGKKVMVLEASDEFGGLLRTFKIGGTELEYYYHHFFLQDKEIQWLINELGLSDRLIYKKTKMGIYAEGKVHDFATSSDLLKFQPLTLLDKIKFAFSSIYLGKMANWKKYEHISALAWFKKWTGNRVTNIIWGPLLKVKFGKYSNKVPLAWMIGRLKQRMQSRRSGDEKLGYIDGSLNVLLTSLLKELNELGVELYSSSAVDELMCEENAIKGVRSKGNTYYADQVVLTIPSPYIVDLVKPHSSTLADRMAQVEYFGAVCVILESDRKWSDIYWLNIADDHFPFGGIIEHTNFIPAEHYNGKHIAYLSRYFTHDEPIAKMSHGEIEEMMMSQLNKIYPEFDRSRVQKVHVFRTHTAATVCDLNFSEKITRVQTPVNGLYIANMAHIYPDERSVNNSIRIAAETCRIMGISTDVPKGTSLAGSVGF